MNKVNKLIAGTALAMSLVSGASVCPAIALPSVEIQPEVATSVWEDNDTEYASVNLNGKELLTYKATSDSHLAEQKAEDLADKLKAVIEDDRFDAQKLLPAREGEVAVLKLDGSTVFKFDAPDIIDGKSNAATPLEQSLKLVNSIRTILGAATLPSSYVKLAEMAAHDAVQTAKGNIFSGAASWYGGKFHGRKTSDGRKYDQNKLTAAHRFLPFGTRLLVRNRKTGDSCVVEICDRGPFVNNRVIDLSKGAAKQLNMISSGVTTVDCLVLENE